MAGVVGRAVQRSFVSVVRSCQSSRAAHSLIRVESQAPGISTGRAAAASEFSSTNAGVGASCFRSRRSSVPRIACAQSLLPLHSAMATARLVSRLSTSSFSAPLLQGSWLSEDI